MQITIEEFALYRDKDNHAQAVSKQTKPIKYNYLNDEVARSVKTEMLKSMLRSFLDLINYPYTDSEIPTLIAEKSLMAMMSLFAETMRKESLENLVSLFQQKGMLEVREVFDKNVKEIVVDSDDKAFFIACAPQGTFIITGNYIAPKIVSDAITPTRNDRDQPREPIQPASSGFVCEIGKPHNTSRFNGGDHKSKTFPQRILAEGLFRGMETYNCFGNPISPAYRQAIYDCYENQRLFAKKRSNKDDQELYESIKLIVDCYADNGNDIIVLGSHDEARQKLKRLVHTGYRNPLFDQLSLVCHPLASINEKTSLEEKLSQLWFWLDYSCVNTFSKVSMQDLLPTTTSRLVDNPLRFQELFKEFLNKEQKDYSTITPWITLTKRHPELTGQGFSDKYKKRLPPSFPKLRYFLDKHLLLYEGGMMVTEPLKGFSGKSRAPIFKPMKVLFYHADLNPLHTPKEIGSGKLKMQGVLFRDDRIEIVKTRTGRYDKAIYIQDKDVEFRPPALYFSKNDVFYLSYMMKDGEVVKERNFSVYERQPLLINPDVRNWDEKTLAILRVFYKSTWLQDEDSFKDLLKDLRSGIYSNEVLYDVLKSQGRVKGNQVYIENPKKHIDNIPNKKLAEKVIQTLKSLYDEVNHTPLSHKPMEKDDLDLDLSDIDFEPETGGEIEDPFDLDLDLSDIDIDFDDDFDF